MKIYYSIPEMPGLKRREPGERIDYRNLKSLRSGV